MSWRISSTERIGKTIQLMNNEELE